MKCYARFFTTQFGATTFIKACREGRVIRIDGRLTRRNMDKIAESECVKRGFIAWQLLGGDRLFDAKPLYPRNYVNNSIVDNLKTDQLYDDLMDAYADDALNVAVAHIQEQLQIATGDVVGMFFAGKYGDTIKDIFKRYIKTEINFKDVQELKGTQ